MCYVRTKIQICHKYFSTFLIPSASFLQPSWISTVTFHLRITSNELLLAAYLHLLITDMYKTYVSRAVRYSG